MTSNKELTDIDDNDALEEGVDGFADKAGEDKFNNDSKRLSTVSKLYDRSSKGYLDDHEKKMRELDTSNRGYLTNDKVYNMLEEQLALQKKVVTQKWLIVGLSAFAVVLALANMGTAFAAATLAKDTTVSETGALTTTGSNKGVSTLGSAFNLDIISPESSESEGNGSRRLSLPQCIGSNRGTVSIEDVQELAERTVTEISIQGTSHRTRCIQYDENADDSSPTLLLGTTYPNPCPPNTYCITVVQNSNFGFYCSGGKRCTLVECESEVCTSTY